MMTTYKEMLDRLAPDEEFSRRTVQKMREKRAETEPKSSRKWIPAVVMAAVLLLALPLGATLWHKDVPAVEPPEAVFNTLTNFETQVTHSWITNTNDSLDDSLYVSFTLRQFSEYAGTNPVPASLPIDAAYSFGTDAEDAEWMARKNEDELEDGYFGSWRVEYGDSPEQVYLRLYAAKVAVFQDELTYETQTTTSVGNTPVLFGFSPTDETLTATFRHNGLEYYLCATDPITKTQFVEIVSAILTG